MRWGCLYSSAWVCRSSVGEDSSKVENEKFSYLAREYVDETTRGKRRLLAGFLITSCGNGATNDEALPGGEGNMPSAPVEQLRRGPSVEFADSEGYRFRLEGLRAQTVVELPAVEDGTEVRSARPGMKFASVELLVTNMQTDRVAPLEDFLLNWYIQVPKQFDADRSMVLCDNSLPNYCGNHVSCLRLDQDGTNAVSLGGLDDDVRTNARRCHMATPVFPW